MEDFALRALESSPGLAIAVIVLAVFLPRLIRSIDNLAQKNTESVEKLSRRNTEEHVALTAIVMHLVSRLNWHEARVYGVNPSTGKDEVESHRHAREAFERAQKELEEAVKQVMIALSDRD